MKTVRFLSAAILALALVCTFSCSSGDDDTGSGGSGCSISGYGTVKIGSQIWMAKNLNCNVSGRKCYDNSEANCDKYGGLYTWAAAMALPTNCNTSSCAPQVGAKHRGICPSGWHIPSVADWNVFMKFVNPSCSDNSTCDGAGTKLKASSGWNSNGNGTDDYGFAALPGGYGLSEGYYFTNVGDFGYWWSANESDSYNAHHGLMYYDHEYVDYRFIHYKSYFLSVRCLKDN